MENYPHHSLTVYAEVHASKLLELHGCQWQRSPFARWFLLKLSHFCDACRKASLEHNDDRRAIEQSMPAPGERDFHVLAVVRYLDAPELLRHEFLDRKVSVYDKAQSRKLTRSYTKIRNSKPLGNICRARMADRSL